MILQKFMQSFIQNCKRKPVSIHDGTLAKRLARSSEVYDFQFVGIMKKDVYNSFEKSKL